VRLLEDPRLIQDELDRRLAAARTADPMQQREKTLQRDLTRIRKSMDRLLTADQEDLLSIDELRWRMPELRHREQSMQTALQSLVEQVNDRAIYLRLAETLSSFLTRLRASADTLDVQERQRIVRLLVRDILVDEDTIVIRHSIPVASTPPADHGSSSPPSGTETPAGPSYRSGLGNLEDCRLSASLPDVHALRSMIQDKPRPDLYLLRTGRYDAALWGSAEAGFEDPVLHDPRFQHRLHEADEPLVVDALGEEVQQHAMVDVIEKPTTSTSTIHFVPFHSRRICSTAVWQERPRQNPCA
jgi:hypothetical protein